MSIAMPAAETIPPAGPSPGAPAGPGRLYDPGVSSSDRNYCMVIHLSPFLLLLGLGPFALLIPLVLWLVRKDESPFIDDHGREVVNFGLTFLLVSFLLFWTIIIPIVYFVIGVVNLIRGSIASSRGEFFRYPMTIRFISS